MTIKSKGWTQKRRKKQAENCKKTKPWKSSTGPKSAEGKKIAADNAFKHGLNSVEGAELIRVLKQQKAFINTQRARMDI